MTFDGTKIYMDDSTNRIWFLNKDTYQQIGYIDVYDNKGPVNKLNELEYINGKIYANVYGTDDILVIDPKTGAVLQKADMTDLYLTRNAGADVLNGIAYDKATGRIFVTGKKWNKLFQVKFFKK
jgi:glutamine cyclotransferase